MSLAHRARLLTPALVLSLVPAYGFVSVDLPVVADELLAQSDNLEHVKNIPYAGGANAGTDLEFATIAVPTGPEGALEERTFSFAGTYQNGLQVVDVTDPASSSVVSVYSCGISQGDVQVFDRDGGTFVTYTMDTGYSANQKTQCFLEAEQKGLWRKSMGVFGTFIADVSDPYNPTTVGFVPVPKGSHNQTVHPSGLYLYNSNSELITNAPSAGIEVYDISDFSAPELVTTLPIVPRPGLGTDSHDITFSEDGTRAYSAALSQTLIIDTTDPAAPSVITSFMDPAINVEHQSDPVTLTDANTGLERDFLIVEDEFAGAAGGEQTCPSGGVHIYDVTGELELAPVKVGYWNIDDLTTTKAAGLGRCTAHVFEIHPEEALMTIAFYNLGVSVVDLSSLVGVALGGNGVGMKEIAFAEFDDSDTWAVKAPFVDRDGVFHIYGNDQARGMDVYRVDLTPAAGAGSEALLGTGRDVWLSPLEADRLLAGRELAADYTPFCLLGDGTAR